MVLQCRRKLEEAVRLADALREFQNRTHDLMSWLRHCTEEIASIDLAKNVTSAEAALETHQEQKVRAEWFLCP